MYNLIKIMPKKCVYRIIIGCLFLLFYSNNASSQSPVTPVSVGVFSNGNNIINESVVPIHYLFRVGNLPYPKLIIQDLYSVFKSNPLFKDSLNVTYFDFYAKRKISQMYLNSFLQSKGYNLDYFKSFDHTVLQDEK